MNTIGGGCSGFNPSLLQGMGDRLKTADGDGNEAISRQEFVDAMEECGLDASKTERLFGRMDGNGDGEVSHQEYQDLMSTMEQRMGGLMGNAGGEKEGFDAVTALMESLQSEADNDDERQRLQDALEKMRTEGYSESTMSESLSLINDIIPGINTSV